ncbi:hypothetical protein [Streptomyces phaeofaciens]|uniref:hypothetical protein n=1 Tax=Streptomyces phaeofaciens TaxID=68254 RepID=UPI0036BCFC49
MVTDAWQRARSSAVELWQRVHPERVPAIEAELTDVRNEVIAAREANDVVTEAELTKDWQRKLERLVRDNPALGRELQRVLDQELTPLLPPPSRRPTPGIVTQTANARDHARIQQAGGNMHNG